jgi:hypothetical protein
LFLNLINPPEKACCPCQLLSRIAPSCPRVDRFIINKSKAGRASASPTLLSIKLSLVLRKKEKEKKEKTAV